MGKKSIFGAAALVALAIGGWLAYSNRHVPEDSLEITASANRVKDGKQAVRTGDLEPGWVIVGGVKRPASDVSAPPTASKSDPANEAEDMDYGRTPPVSADLNPHTLSVAEALKDKKRYPERLSVAVPSKPFDRKAYEANPETYLQTVEPARVFATAEPGPGVHRLTAITPYYQVVQQGEAVALEVQALPGAPVTFTSFDLGRFSENRLVSVSVRADENGVAQVHFEGTPGTISSVNILAGCPLASSQVKFVVDVKLPDGE